MRIRSRSTSTVYHNEITWKLRDIIRFFLFYILLWDWALVIFIAPRRFSKNKIHFQNTARYAKILPDIAICSPFWIHSPLLRDTLASFKGRSLPTPWEARGLVGLSDPIWGGGDHLATLPSLLHPQKKILSFYLRDLHRLPLLFLWSSHLHLTKKSLVTRSLSLLSNPC